MRVAGWKCLTSPILGALAGEVIFDRTNHLAAESTQT